MKTSPIYFYISPQNWPPQEALQDPDGGNSHLFQNAEWGWILQTYLRLKDRQQPVQLTDTLPSSGIVVLMSGRVPRSYRPSAEQFLVSVSGDEAPDVYAQMRIVQNRMQTRLLGGSTFVPFWTQPGLRKRSESRGSIFSSLAYFGDKGNLSREFKDERWSSFLTSRGLQWHVRDAWTADVVNCSDIDCVVAVRDFRRGGYIRKPATKLFNAWIAGVPAILGREFAFREQRRSPLDYIEVGSFDDACAAIDKLTKSPELRSQMTANGQQRAAEVTAEAICKRWEHALFELAPEAAARWAGKSGLGRKVFFSRATVGKVARGAVHRAARVVGQEQYVI